MAKDRAAYLFACKMIACTALILLASTCTGNISGNGDGGNGGNIDGAAGPDGGANTVDGMFADAAGCVPVSCSGRVTECGDCLDNDSDGRIDYLDIECLGPCDNTEGPTLEGGVGGQTGGPCKSDCYFDWGNGSGNDDCFWDHRCDPLAVAPDYPPEGISCEYDPTRLGGMTCPDVQSQQCHDFCDVLTPSGCDCFGCCTLPGLETAGPNGTPGYVWIGALDGNGTGTCTLADVTNTTLCPPCTPVGDCLNDCGRCELCVGQTELPPDCVDQCPGGEQPCGLPGQDPCPGSYYCISGCCQAIPQ